MLFNGMGRKRPVSAPGAYILKGKRDHACKGPQSDSGRQGQIRPQKKPHGCGSGQKLAWNGKEKFPQRGRREEERQEFLVGFVWS